MSKLLSRNVLAALALILPATATAQPVINAVTNNFGGPLPGLPNYGIAPASTLIIYGSAMCDNVPLVVQSSSGAGLPNTLNGMEIFVNVKGVVTTPHIYYAVPTQVAAVLPSTTPVGTGTITVKYKGQTGVAPITVTKSAFGILTANGAGSGLVKAYDLNYKEITPTASAAPGQTIILWGSGLGADTANNDRTYPMKQDNLNNATVYIGGVKADVIYAGRSLFPGVDQIDVTLPALGAAPAFEAASFEGQTGPSAATGFRTGCSDSVVVVAGDNSSNFTTLPVALNNGVCEDTAYGITGNGFPQSKLTTLTVGGMSILQITQPNAALPAPQTYSTYYDVGGDFFSEPGRYFGNSAPFVSPGSCIESSTSTKPSTSTAPPVLNPLNVGTPIVLTGGDPFTVSIPEVITTPFAYYSATFVTPTLTNGTQLIFAAPGSSEISPFTVSTTWQDLITLQSPPVSGGSATSQGQLIARSSGSSTNTITESQGQLITWTDGPPNSWVIVSGTSNAPAVSLNVTFYCAALASDGQLLLPPYLLDTLPPGVGTLFVENETQPQPFTVKGIDFGYTVTGLVSSENVTYQLDASTTPPSVDQYNGTYAGTYSGIVKETGKNISGTTTSTVDDGVLTVTSPGTGTGTVSSDGAITFGTTITGDVACNFSGQGVISGGVASASGTFSCATGNTSGTWSDTRTSLAAARQ
jgi:uncharacterized protein (TIGR03437 family)